MICTTEHSLHCQVPEIQVGNKENPELLQMTSLYRPCINALNDSADGVTYIECDSKAELNHIVVVGDSYVAGNGASWVYNDDGDIDAAQSKEAVKAGMVLNTFVDSQPDRRVFWVSTTSVCQPRYFVNTEADRQMDSFSLEEICWVVGKRLVTRHLRSHPLDQCMHVDNTAPYADGIKQIVLPTAGAILFGPEELHPPKCFRNQHSWPILFAKKFNYRSGEGKQPKKPNVETVACQGARTRNFLHDVQEDTSATQKFQLDGLARSISKDGSTNVFDLMVFSMGGNNAGSLVKETFVAGFATIVFECLLFESNFVNSMPGVSDLPKSGKFDGNKLDDAMECIAAFANARSSALMWEKENKEALRDIAKYYMAKGGVIMYMDYAFLERGCHIDKEDSDRLATLRYEEDDPDDYTDGDDNPSSTKLKEGIWKFAEKYYFSKHFNDLVEIKKAFDEVFVVQSKWKDYHPWSLQIGKGVCNLMREAYAIQQKIVDDLEPEMRELGVKLVRVPVKEYFYGHEPINSVSAIIGYPGHDATGKWWDTWFVHVRDVMDMTVAKVEPFHYNRNGHLMLADAVFKDYAEAIHKWRSELLSTATPDVKVVPVVPLPPSMRKMRPADNEHKHDC
jgi:hypothetical protein